MNGTKKISMYFFLCYLAVSKKIFTMKSLIVLFIPAFIFGSVCTGANRWWSHWQLFKCHWREKKCWLSVKWMATWMCRVLISGLPLLFRRSVGSHTDRYKCAGYGRRLPDYDTRKDGIICLSGANSTGKVSEPDLKAGQNSGFTKSLFTTRKGNTIRTAG